MQTAGLAAARDRAGMSARSDAELVAQSRSGSLRAFEEIMRRNNRRLYRTARSILRDEGEAEDVVQETYIRAFQRLDSLAEAARLTPWLVRIAANEALDRLRRRPPLLALPAFEANGPRLGQAPDPPAGGLLLEGQAMAAPHDDPEASAARGEIRRLIEAAVDEMPQAFRAVFVLRAMEELSTAETAACLGIPEDTVKTRFHRAKRSLRKLLNRQLEAALVGSFPFGGARCDRLVARVLARLEQGRVTPQRRDP